MSEYQYVVFQAVDRPLNDKQLQFAERQSTRTKVSRWSLAVEYPWGQNTEPTSKPLENADFTLAHSINLSRRLKASMRSDAAATQPLFGGLCHQLIGIAGPAIKPPFLE